ncbi:MAG: hypothetical protein ACOYM9_03825 [Bradymonadia bacterium]|jgi:hypothetical protein
MCAALRWIRVAVSLGALGVPGRLWAAEPAVDGSLRLRGLYGRDSGGGPTLGIGFLDTDVRARDLTSTGLGGTVDATFVLDVTEAHERRFGEIPSIDQVRDLFLVHPFADARVRAYVGRQLLNEAGNAWVDGGRVEVDVDGPDAQVGLYAGLSPDPYDAAPRTDRQATGVFGALHRDGLDVALAWNAVLDGSTLDRHFLYQRTHWRAARDLFLATYLVADLVTTPAVTTALASADYTPVPEVNLTLNLSRYAIEQYRDAAVYRNLVEPNQALLLGDEVVDLVYERARLTVSFRLPGDWREYQSLEWKHRSQDDRSAWQSTIGVRQADAFGVGLDLDTHVQFHNGFESDTWLAALDLDQDLGGRFSVNGRVTWFNGRTIGRTTDRGRLFDEAQEVWLFGGGVTWRPVRGHQIDLDYDAALETELQDQRNDDAVWIHTVMARYAYYY